jgi:hypothetical protein
MTDNEKFSAGGYRFQDLKDARIVSSRSDLLGKQRNFGFPRPIKTGERTAWYPKSEVHAWLAARALLRDKRIANK